MGRGERESERSGKRVNKRASLLGHRASATASSFPSPPCNRRRILDIGSRKFAEGAKEGAVGRTTIQIFIFFRVILLLYSLISLEVPREISN